MIALLWQFGCVTTPFYHKENHYGFFCLSVQLDFTIDQKYITWVKADLTFEGLQQTLLQPEERVYIGKLPDVLKIKNSHRQNYILSVIVKRIDNPINKNVEWFNFELPLNNGLISIIGNKGSGKSALSDIIALLANCKTVEKGSFLELQRFKKTDKKYSKDYVGRLIWEDGKKDDFISLDNSPNNAAENAQYLPQRYIEEVCNNLENEFRDEINKVIFSYVDVTERGTASNLKELIDQKSVALREAIDQKTSELKEINTTIIALEDKLKPSYKESIMANLSKYQEKLERHMKNKPVEVKKPEQNNPEYVSKLNSINGKIQELEQQIYNKEETLYRVNTVLNKLNVALTRIEYFKKSVGKINEDLNILSIDLKKLSEEYSIPNLRIETNIDVHINTITSKINEITELKRIINDELGTAEYSTEESLLME